MSKNAIIPIGLGAGKISQFSISENVDQIKIEKILLSNIDTIEEYSYK